MTRVDFVLPKKPAATDRKVLLDALIAFNADTAGPAGWQLFVCLLRAPKIGKTLGGD